MKLNRFRDKKNLYHTFIPFGGLKFNEKNILNYCIYKYMNFGMKTGLNEFNSRTL